VERSEDYPNPRERGSRPDRELATNFNHKLYVQDIYLFDGESIPRNEFDNEDLLGHVKGIHPENERMQRTRNSLK
jgi:quinolinate synthase